MCTPLQDYLDQKDITEYHKMGDEKIIVDIKERILRLLSLLDI